MTNASIVSTNRPYALRDADARRIANAGQLNDADEARLRVAFHEAGHAVAAVVLGARVRRAVLGSQPQTQFAGPHPSGTEAPITYAGPWAEARFDAGQRPGPRALDAAFARHGHKDGQALIAAGGAHLGHSAAPLLERCWPAVKTIAAALFLDGEIGHADVCAALGITDDGGPNSAQLASIRSGLRAVEPSRP